VKQQNHHYYPRFALTRWSGDDGLLQPFEWNPRAKNGPVIPCNRASPKAACSELDLYALGDAPQDERYEMELDFFGPKIDAPAAKVLEAIERDGVDALDDRQRQAWARFLVSLPARTPEAINERGVQMLRTKLDEDPESYIGLKGDDDPPTLSEWADKNRPDLMRDSVLRMLVEIIFETDAVRKVADMEWWTRRPGSRQVLIGDRPLLSSTGQEDAPCAFNADDPHHLIVLPISPTTVFFASHDKRIRSRLRSASHSSIAMRINNETLRAAKNHVFATDRNVQTFVGKKWPEWRR